MDKEWHSSDELQEALVDFHQEKCELTPRFKHEKELHHKIVMSYLRDELKKKGILDFKFTGSTAEGIKVPTSRMEFDVMVVYSADENFILQEVPGNALYARILDTGTWSYSIRNVTPEATVTSLFSTLQVLLQRSCGIHVKLRRHGPAVQMDVYKDEGKRELFYHVDMVPSYRFIENNKYVYYVPKPDSSMECLYEYKSETWRRSFSLEEVALLRDIDADGGCRKKCMRILKALMKDTEAGLYHLNSYLIKTAMLSLLRDFKKLDWSEENLGQRLMDYLKYIVRALEQRCLPHYFVCTYNLLQPPSKYINICSRLKELIRSEKKFHQLIPRAYRIVLEGRRSSSLSDSGQASLAWPRAWRSERSENYHHYSPVMQSTSWKLIRGCATLIFYFIIVCLFMVIIIVIDSYKR